MEIILDPAAGGDNLAALLSADPQRRAIARAIFARLESDGRFGRRALDYIAAAPLRRATLRSILSAAGQRIPEWTREGSKAERRRANLAAIPVA